MDARVVEDGDDELLQFDLLVGGHLPAPPAPPAASRGTVVVLTGRGEHPGVYERFGRRLAADGYTVALPDDPLQVPQAFAAHAEGTRVLLGSDTGALAAWAWAAEHPGAVDALVLAGLPLTEEAAPELDREGELDLVARERDGTVVFCEVKTRSGTGFGEPAEAVGPVKARRLRAVACRWLEEHRPDGRRELRFDVVSVLRRPGAAPQVSHLRGAF